MIRRGFWLTAGAVTGIYGYRRVSALGRRLSASLSPAGRGPGESPGGTRLANGARRGAISMGRETYRFTRDVREGMDLYMARHSARAGSTLSTDRSTDYEPKDGR
jgi:hypothetical protein